MPVPAPDVGEDVIAELAILYEATYKRASKKRPATAHLAAIRAVLRRYNAIMGWS